MSIYYSRSEKASGNGPVTNYRRRHDFFFTVKIKTRVYYARSLNYIDTRIRDNIGWCIYAYG